MSKHDDSPFAITLKVRDSCLCLYAQRAARSLARRFDEAFRPFSITSGQFSLMMALNRPKAPRMSDVAAVLGMDRTTLTANLKPLERRGLVMVNADETDRRSRVLALTPAGRQLLAAAVPVWEETQAGMERLLADPERLRTDLRALS